MKPDELLKHLFTMTDLDWVRMAEKQCTHPDHRQPQRLTEIEVRELEELVGYPWECPECHLESIRPGIRLVLDYIRQHHFQKTTTEYTGEGHGTG